MLTIAIPAELAQVHLHRGHQKENVFMSVKMIAFFHLQWPWKSSLSVCTSVLASVKQIGFETDDIRDMTRHSNTKMFPLTNASLSVM